MLADTDLIHFGEKARVTNDPQGVAKKYPNQMFQQNSSRQPASMSKCFLRQNRSQRSNVSPPPPILISAHGLLSPPPKNPSVDNLTNKTSTKSAPMESASKRFESKKASDTAESRCKQQKTDTIYLRANTGFSRNANYSLNSTKRYNTVYNSFKWWKVVFETTKSVCKKYTYEHMIERKEEETFNGHFWESVHVMLKWLNRFCRKAFEKAKKSQSTWLLVRMYMTRLVEPFYAKIKNMRSKTNIREKNFTDYSV